MQSIQKNKSGIWNQHLTTGLCMITLLVFVLELVTPPGIATSIAYIFVVFLCYFDTDYKKIYFFSTLCIVLVVADFFISHSGLNGDPVVLFNRLIALTCIVMAAIITTKFKKLTQKHQNNEILMKSILSSANESVMVINNSGEIVYNNESAIKMFGFDDHDLKGRKIAELVPEEFKDNEEAILSEIGLKPRSHAMESGMEIKAKRKNGTEFPIDLRLGHFNNKEGAFFTCFIMDISTRKEAEEEVKKKKEALEKSESFLNSILRNIPLHILVRDSETNRIVLENKKMREVIEFCDYDPSEITSGNLLCDCITSEQAIKVLEADEEVKRTAKTVIIPEFHMYSQAGEETVIRLIKAPITDANGKTIYLINICEDITGRILAQRELRKKHELLLESQEIGNVGSFESDLSYRTIKLSNEMMHIVGVEPKPHYPFNALMDYIHQEDRERVNKGLKSAISDKTLCDEKYRIIRPDGELKYIWLKAKAICDEEGRPSHLRGVISDITELKKAEENLKEYIVGLKQMMFMTSHKVRLPIANIIGISNIFEQSLQSPEVLKKLIDYLKLSAQSLDVFTKELTQFMEHFKSDKEH